MTMDNLFLCNPSCTCRRKRKTPSGPRPQNQGVLGQPRPPQPRLILSTIELLLSYCTRFYDRQFFTRTNLNQDHATRFGDMLKAYFERDQHLVQGLPTVKGCGQELGMSGAYLSDLLKQETGLSAQEHIHRHVIDKAKTKLLCSNQSVSQIAFDLGFEYPQHFSRLFKSKTGLTPVQFRTVN